LSALLEIEGLRTEIRRRKDTVRPVDGVSLTVHQGETVGLVGESGCGKTMTAMSVLRLLPPGGHVTSGQIRLSGTDLVPLSANEMRKIRGRDIAMVFQDPMTSLNPTMTIGRQIAGPVRVHLGLAQAAAMNRAEEVLGLVGVPRPAERLGDYPHQLSGGLRQRVMIAMALACEPKLLIADEPTTALDVTIQAQILELLSDLAQRLNMGMLLVTHDMGVIAGRTDRVLVMYAGRIVEAAGTDELFSGPRHPYTEALLGSIPRLDQPRDQQLQVIPGRPPDLASPPAGCRFASRCSYATQECRDQDPALDGPDPAHSYACFHPRPAAPEPGRSTAASNTAASSTAASNTAIASPRATGTGGESTSIDSTSLDSTGDSQVPLLELTDVHKEFGVHAGVLQRRVASVKAVSGVSFSVAAGETFGLVGESGCGKTTIGRLIATLERADSGSVRFEGTDLGSLSGRRLRQARRQVQLMFQDAYASLDPRMPAGASIREPLMVQHVGTRATRAATVNDLLDKVGLPRSAVTRYPHEFSGGQRQRIGLARALALNPQLVVADEPVSALDVSIQSQVLNLMKSLQADFGLTLIVISHDLSVVRYLADRIGVMYLGKLVEIGPATQIYARPAHPYTASLLAAVPVPDPRQERAKQRAVIAGELPSALHPPSGCRFRTRCPKAQDLCAAQEPPPRPFGEGHLAACHFPLEPALTASVSPPPAAATSP
jgi:oligopeptide/dipeptide ABC transporter ATP-binding protein